MPAKPPQPPPQPTRPEAEAARAVAPVLVYPPETLPAPDLGLYRVARASAAKVAELVIPPRSARCFTVPAGYVFRIACLEGPQVGDLNLWSADTLSEHFFSGKTRALHGTHVSTGDRLWSSLPYLRPMATILADTLDWYGTDPYGGRVHDVIGTRCDPYTNQLLTGAAYPHCCHSNLTRALADHLGVAPEAAEPHIHDVLNVFMCTGFTRDTGQYFMKASPVRAGDYLELFAEIDLIAALSACPGGDCGTGHSSDAARCYPLGVEIYQPAPGALDGWQIPAPNAYDRRHGIAPAPQPL